MKSLLSILFILFLAANQLLATHNRAGEITYKCDSLNPLKYHITITTYTKESSVPADRCELVINFGDSTSDTIPRSNGPVGTCPSPAKMGISLGNDIKKNEYKTTHVYGGPGVFTISVEDPNRNSNIMNINNSVDVAFYLESELVISGFSNCNSSPVLGNPPVENGCVYQVYEHNPAAWDPDGDSLVFSLVPCKGQNGLPIPNYVYPNQVQGCDGGTFSIDAHTGTVTWDYPLCIGEYNFAILIQEYRNSSLIGSVLRDMQVTIGNCDNIKPVIEALTPICVIAGDTIVKQIIARDPNGDQVELTATGEPFGLSNSPALFNQPVYGQDSVVDTFFWATVCQHIRPQLYQVVFRAEDDNSPISLVDYETLDILVIGPEPLNPMATPQGNAIILTWDPPICGNATGYNIYRRADSTGWSPAYCETGVPEYTGYSKIASVAGISNTSFLDDNNGAGLVHGQNYCYLLTANYPTGAEGIASEEFCAELKKDVPVITHVSVKQTAKDSGANIVIWSAPTELDSLEYPGPYLYKIYRSPGFNPASNPIYTTNSNVSIKNVDTIYVDTFLNTYDLPNTYRVDMFSDTVFAGSTQNASSVFLSSTPSDNKLLLSWQEIVPWTNHKYVVYRYDNNMGQYILLDTVFTNTYPDSGLVNEHEYCYYVKSIGSYSSAGFINPIINLSQEHCNAPVDTTAPCSPEGLLIDRDCDQVENTLYWSKPDMNCGDDVVGYYIYYAPQLGLEPSLIDSVASPSITHYLHTNLTSVAGCYAVSSVDSFGNVSAMSEIVCTDNCPNYHLPNVFTPGGDGMNDYFIPFPYKFVESIDLKIFNRWGQIVFTTTDPDIMWDGTNQETSYNVTDGTYYYICDVYEIRLTGIEKRTLTGYVQLLREANSNIVK